MLTKILLAVVAVFALTACSDRDGTSAMPAPTTPTVPTPAPVPPAAPAPAPEPPVDLTDPDSFWSTFRRAVLADDVAAVAALTKFPLTTRGSMDHCPEVEHDRAAFDTLWPQLLAVDPGLGHQENMRGLIERLDAIVGSERRHLEQGGDLRMGDFEFRKNAAGELRLTYAYWAADGC